MKKPNFRLRDKDGSALVIALMILVILTLIGIAATNTSIIEMQIAGNEKAYKEAFYKADAGVSYVVATYPSVSSYPISVDIDNDGNDDFKVDKGPSGIIDFGPPKEIEIQSDSLGGPGNVSIIAGVRYPTQGGALEGTGEEGEY
ncbi:MAG: hypothetical protein C4B58_00555 [Deltaproteobacteria bacterium]|nr:MAG: hypothetical protein C4B58_00555 [Deltaproteobacteria bacterium]